MRAVQRSAAALPPRLETLEPRLLLSAAPPMDALLAADLPPGVIVVPQTEQESVGGPANDALQSAEPLAFSYLVPNISAVDGAGPQQAAVTGVGEGAAGPGYDQTVTAFSQLYGGRTANVSLNGLTLPGGDGVLTINALADLGGAEKYLTLQADGMNLGQVFVDDGVSGSKSSTQVVLTQGRLAELAADGAVTFSFTASASVLPSGTNYVQVRLAYPGPAGGDPDYYSFELGVGDSASLAVAGDGEFTLDVYDAAGGLMASAEASGPGSVAAIEDLLAAGAGTYYVKVEGSGEYTLAVDRNATLDAGGNDGLDAAQAVAGATVAGRQWIIGAIDGAGDADVFSLSPVSRGVLNVQAHTPAAKGNLNELAPVLRLYDSSDELVAVSENGRLQYRVPKGGEGDYSIEVLGTNQLGGNYVLSVKSPKM